MTPMRLATVALLALLATPAASAWPWDPVQVQLAPLRQGDVLSFELARSVEDEGSSTFVVRVEGASRVVDAFGIERASDAFRIDRYDEGVLVLSETCHQLVGGHEAVRREIHSGADERRTPRYEIAAPGAPVGLHETFRVTSRRSADFADAPCDAPTPVALQSLREGDRIRLGDILPHLAPVDEEIGRALSEPARPVEWEGRGALSLRYDIRWFVALWAPDGATAADVVGEVEFVFADGMPRSVGSTGRWTIWPDGGAAAVATETRRLVGYAPAPDAAPALAPYARAQLPERSPLAQFAPRSRLVLDDEGLDLAFRFAEAWGSILADPRMPHAAFVEANDDAFLQEAHYAAGARDPDLADVPAVGEWKIVLCSADECIAGASVKLDPAGPLPVKPTKNRLVAAPAPDAPPLGDAADIASGADTAALARTLVGSEEPWGRVGYWAGGREGPYAAMALSIPGGKDPERGDEAGRHTFLDLLRARSVGIDDEVVDQEGGLGDALAIVGPPAVTARSSATPAPAHPLWAPALAVGAAAAGVALIAALLKVLAPFFTRIVQDSLLENAARRGLFERVKREPGVHRAALIEAAGVGNGAARHHLDQLVRHKLLFRVQADGYVRYFAVGDVPPDAARQASALLAGSHRAVYEVFAAEPALTLRDAAKRLGLSPPSVYRAKRKLEKAGLLPTSGPVRLAARR